MSAAARPTSAVLRRARHVPVTRCLARRWQTNTAQAQTYEQMLSGLEVEFPDPDKAPSRTNHSDDGDKSRRKNRASPESASLPTVDPFGTETPIKTGKKARSVPPPNWKKMPRNDHESVKPPLQERPSTYNKDLQESRRRPPPTFKPSSEPATTQDVPEKPTIPRARHAYSEPEQPRVVHEAEFPQELRAFPHGLSEIPLPPKSAAELDSDLTKQKDVSKSVEPSKPRPKPAQPSNPRPKPAQPSQKHSASTDTPAPELDGPESLASPMNPSETVKLWIPLESSGKDVAVYYDNIFLRDSCACTECVDASTRQKRFDSADIPSNIAIRMLKYKDDDVVITWKHDIAGFGLDHRTRLSRDFLRRAPRGYLETAYVGGKRAWTTAELEGQLIDYDYNHYMSDEKVLFQLLRQLHTFGLVFIKNVPESESAVIDTANRIGPLKNTFYGDTWDVRSVSNAKNVAYTDDHLGFHMDLLYMQQPPRLQLLHCLRASEQGGISLFSDTYQAVDQLHLMDPDAFDALTELPVNFHYDNDNHHYFRSRRTFQVREGLAKPTRKGKRVHHRLEAVNWAPPFQAPFSHSDGNVALAQSTRRWHDAAQLFKNLTEMKSAVYRRQMAPGECVIFDNRRVLHARTAFAGGERWLRGAYLDDDPYLSKIRVLERTHGSIQDKAWLEATPPT